MKYPRLAFLFVLLVLGASATPAHAVTLLGRVTVTVAGFQNYNVTRTEGIDIRVQNVPFQSEPDGFFRTDTQAIITGMEDLPVKWTASNENQISLKLGITKIGMPVDWLGWKVGNFILLQAVTCSVDAGGGAFCQQANEDRAMLMQRYGVRFSLPELQANQGVIIRSSLDTTSPTPVVRPQGPEIVRPAPVVTPPQIVRPAAPVPAPLPAPDTIVGPSD